MMRGALTLAALAVATPALAQQPPGSQQTRDFIAEAAQSDVFEMMEAYSALAGSQNPDVQAFARRMIADHGKTSAALRRATQQAGLEPPPMQMNGTQSSFLAALQSARGAAFDKLYWHQQALGHRAALVVEQRYTDSGDTPAIRQTARDAIPLIQSHLPMAERMEQATGQ